MKLNQYIVAVLNNNGTQRDRANKITEWWNSICRGEDIVGKCENCGEYHFEDDGREVLGRRGTSHWCESCVDDSAFSCADCSTYCDSDEHEHTNDRDNSICNSCDEEYFYCEGCDRTRSNSDYGEDGRCESCTPNEDDYGIPEYHSEDRNFNVRYKSAVFGVELEIKVKNECDVTDVYSRILRHGFIGERDGSLDGVLGIEIVGKPMTFEQNRDKWLPLLSSIRGSAVGWNAGTGYGMHVSLNRTSMTTLHQGKVLVFIHGNKNLCEKVAGRKETSWARYHSKKLGDAKHGCDEKYQAISLRSDTRMEVRIFRSTLSPEGFMRNLEFVAAIVAFTKSASAEALTDGDFRIWLSEPINRKSYPNLYAHLFPAVVQESKAKLTRHLQSVSQS